MRTNNYFELRNREMGFYTELRTAIILARINVDRTALRLFRERANAIRRVLANRYRGEGGEKRKKSYHSDISYRTILYTSFQIEKDRLYRLERITFLSDVLIQFSFSYIFKLCQVYTVIYIGQVELTYQLLFLTHTRLKLCVYPICVIRHAVIRRYRLS